MRKTQYRIVLPERDDLMKMRVMLAERLEQWALDYEERGVEKGIGKGEMLALQKLLVKRFGAIYSM
jgi:hypothetical protein